MRRGALDIHHSNGIIQSVEESYATTKRANKLAPARAPRYYHHSKEVRDDDDNYRSNKDAVFVEDSRDEEESVEREDSSSRNSRNSSEPTNADNSMIGRKAYQPKYPVTPIRRSSTPYSYHHHQHNHHHYFAPSPPGRNAHECNYYHSPTIATDSHFFPHPVSYSTPPNTRLPRKKRAVFDKQNRQDVGQGFVEFKENSNPQAHVVNPKKQRIVYTPNHESEHGSNSVNCSHMTDTFSTMSEHTLPKSVTQDDDESQTGASLPAVKSFDTENDLMGMIQTQMSWNSNTTTGDVSSIGDMTEWQDNDDYSSTSAIRVTKHHLDEKEGCTKERIEKLKEGQECRSRDHSICDSTTSSMTTTKTTSRSIDIKKHDAHRTKHITDDLNHDNYHLVERSRYQFYDNRGYCDMMRQPLPITPMSGFHQCRPPPPPPPKYMTTPPPSMPHYWQPYSMATASTPPSSMSMDPLETKKIADHVSTLTPPYPSKLPLSLYKHRCTLLKPPLPSKSSTHQSDDNDEDDEDLPCFSLLINYPSVPFNNVKRNSLGFKYCIMCGLACPIRNPTAKYEDKESDRPTIPAQNKGLCTHCDVAIWVAQTITSKATRRPLEIKWCKGCKNFHSWAAFGSKGLATKCTKCRNRQKEKYHAQKKQHEQQSGMKENDEKRE